MDYGILNIVMYNQKVSGMVSINHITLQPSLVFVGPIASQYGAMGFEDSQSGFLLQKTIQKRLDVYCHPTRSLSYVLYVFV